MAKEATDLMAGTRETVLAELDTTGAAARQTAEIQMAAMMAVRKPRDEDEVRDRIVKACERLKFAERATYAFPRGGATVTGPSVYLAREFARLWGNLREGFDVIHDDEEQRTIRCYAWDLESNAFSSCSDTFRKLVQRKGKGWVTPDERDLRELTNRHAAIGIRNSILSLLPDDLVDDAIEAAAKTIGKMGKDSDYMNRLLGAFADLRVTQADLEKYLGKPLTKLSGDDVAKLRATYEAIRNDFSKREEYFGNQAPAEEGKTGGLSRENLKKKEEEKPARTEVKSDDEAKCINQAQAAAILNALKKTSLDREVLDRYLHMNYGCELSELPAEHFDDLADWIKAQSQGAGNGRQSEPSRAQDQEGPADEKGSRPLF